MRWAARAQAVRGVSFGWRYLRQSWIRVVLLAGVLLAATITQLVTPVILREFVDSHTGGPSAESALFYAAAFVAVAVTGHLLSILEAAMAADVGWRATNRLRAELLGHTLRLPLNYHSQVTPGSLVERVDGDSAVLSNFFSRFILLTIGESLYAVGLICALTLVDWRVGAGFAGVTVAALVVLRLQGRRGRVAAMHLRAVTAEVVAMADEHSSMRADIVANGAYEHVSRQQEEKLSRLRRAELRSSLLASSLPWCTSSFAVTVAAVTALAVSTSLVLSGRMEIGTAFLIFTYTQQLIRPLDRLSLQMQDYQLAMAALDRSRDLLAVHDEEKCVAPRHPHAVPLNRSGSRTAVQLNSIWYSYGDQPVVQDISLVIGHGEVVGVVGRTGSGKSTIARLIAGLHPIQRGRLIIDGEDAADLGLREVRRRVTLVSQEVELFHASVRDNVRMFDESISDTEVLRALELVGLKRWLTDCTDRLDTAVDPARPGLSGGQMQLLATARAVLRDPRVVVLDEAASRLDQATETAMHTALSHLLGNGRSGLVVAHRLSSLRHVDRVVVMDGGRVVESGNRDHLALQGGRFTSLITASGASPATLDTLWGRS